MLLINEILSLAAILHSVSATSAADTAQQSNQTSENFLQSSLYGFEKRPEDCPPCFNCNLEDFQCLQFAPCSKANGRCNCPAGFGGIDCADPLCGSLADGKDREPRKGKSCDCDDGWGGINCNVCQTNKACDAMMPYGSGGVCFQEGLLVKENYQTCDITNRKILDQLKGQKPQATFSCNADDAECTFQCKLSLST